jgi:hypothetical protein
MVVIRHGHGLSRGQVRINYRRALARTFVFDLLSERRRGVHGWVASLVFDAVSSQAGGTVHVRADMYVRPYLRFDVAAGTTDVEQIPGRTHTGSTP